MVHRDLLAFTEHTMTHLIWHGCIIYMIHPPIVIHRASLCAKRQYACIRLVVPFLDSGDYTAPKIAPKDSSSSKGQRSFAIKLSCAGTQHGAVPGSMNKSKVNFSRRPSLSLYTTKQQLGSTHFISPSIEMPFLNFLLIGTYYTQGLIYIIRCLATFGYKITYKVSRWQQPHDR